VPPLIDQGQSVMDHFPEYTADLERFIERYPSLEERYLDIKENGLGDDTELPWSDVVAIGITVVSRIANFFFVLCWCSPFISCLKVNDRIASWPTTAPHDCATGFGARSRS
jgi:hypothetical protein